MTKFRPIVFHVAVAWALADAGCTAGVGGGGNPTGGASGGAPVIRPSTGGAPSGTGGAMSSSGGAPALTGGRGSGGGGTGGAGSGGNNGASATGGGGGGVGSGGSSGSGGSIDPCAAALFCDDFETYAAGPAPNGNWTTQINLGSIAVDTTQFHSGTKSVRFSTQAASGSKTAFIRLTSRAVFPVAGNLFYGRMMFRLESPPATSVHWTFIQAGGLVPGQTYHALYRYGGQLPVMQGTMFVGSQLIANYDTPDWYSGRGPGSDCWKHANRTVVPVGVWSCVEWRFDGPNNDMRMWLNERALPDLTVTGTGQGCVNAPANYTWAAPTFDTLYLGWDSPQADDTRTVWIDDVVLSQSQVGCPSP